MHFQQSASLFDHLIGEREQWSIDLDQTVYRHNA